MAQAPFLVALSDTPAAYEALALAGSLARLQKTFVYGVHVIEVARSLPLNAEMEIEAHRGEQLLRRADDMAKRAEFPLERELLQSRQAGEAIVDEAATRHAAAIVLGVPMRHSFGELSLGRTAAYVLKHATCRVIVVREAASE
jgi:nucleotide-binding universal stress UspA family protein